MKDKTLPATLSLFIFRNNSRTPFMYTISNLLVSPKDVVKFSKRQVFLYAYNKYLFSPGTTAWSQEKIDLKIKGYIALYTYLTLYTFTPICQNSLPPNAILAAIVILS